MIKPWPVTSSRSLGNFKIFTLREESKVSPRTGQPHDFFVMDCPNWVNVIALTPSGEMVLVEQFRHGSKTVELEIPGGVIDPGDASPVEAATRELREETGYVGENARLIGDNHPNPAIQSNTCYTVLVENCHPVAEVDFDHGEDLATRLCPASEVPALVADGRIRHALVIVALYQFELWRDKHAARA
jgi:8-oxo-dGTP pyrophosphatase MutT (NUDIX family)